MPRDANGNYTLPPENPVVTGTLITSSWANGTMPDLGQEIQDSLSRSGKGSMQAPLLILDESGGVPGVAFRDETNSGLKRVSAGDIRLAAQGQDIFRTNPATKGPEGWDNVLQQWISLLPQALPVNPPTTADLVSYDNTTSGLAATDTQAAIDEVVQNAATAPPPDADEIPYDNTTSQLVAAEVQAAIDELVTLLDAQPPPYVNPNRILTGRIVGITGLANKTSGGYTSSRTGTGLFNVLFDTPITEEYVVVVSPAYDGWGTTVNAHSEDNNGFQVKVADAETGVLQDRDWSFHLYYLSQS